jgi:signal transduction histidine kinase
MFSQLIHKIVGPKSVGKDKARQEFILNVLLVGSFCLSFFAFCIVVFARYTNSSVENGFGPQIVFLFLIFFASLYWLSRKGKVRLSALLLVGSFYIIGFYTSFEWGTDVTQAWLTYALLIVMSGVLVGTRFAFFLTLSLVILISILSYFQLSGMYEISRSWRSEPYTFADTVLLNITLVVISIIAWLSNRETEKSLKRARASEAELKRERDSLEVKIEERTKDLKRAQLEKLAQLYRFAEIGRLSSSLFHDLVTPLSLISLNLERLKHKREQGSIENMQTQLQKAIKATKYLETFVVAVRKQLQNEESKKIFSLNKEIKLVMQMIRHKANNMQVKVTIEAPQEIKTYGSQIKFNQLMTNLFLNAIDAYEGEEINKKKRGVFVSLQENQGEVILSIKDNGVGIHKEHMKKIFLPFFTTKPSERGTGIGLSISQEIVERSFGGTIHVRSDKSEGTIFTIMFPLVKSKKEINETLALGPSN